MKNADEILLYSDLSIQLNPRIQCQPADPTATLWVRPDGPGCYSSIRLNHRIGYGLRSNPLGSDPIRSLPTQEIVSVIDSTSRSSFSKLKSYSVSATVKVFNRCLIPIWSMDHWQRTSENLCYPVWLSVLEECIGVLRRPTSD